MRTLALALVPLFLTPTPAGAQNGPSVDIQEWEVPYADSRPRDPYVAPDGRVWFVGQRGHYIAVLDPSSGQFKKYDLEPGTGPHNLVVDAEGIVWYAGNLKSHIGRLDPKTGAITKIAMPDPAVRDPHTLVFDRRGDIWFTAQGANYVGRLSRSSGNVDLIKVSTPNARPYGIKVDSSGVPWVVLFGTNRLARVDPAAMALTEIALPRADARPRRLEITGDGRIWYVDYAKGMLGAYDPKTGGFREWATPGGTGSQPYGMACDDMDRIWFVEGGSPNQFVGFDTRAGRFLGSTPIPSGGGTVRHMHYHAPTRQVWFGTDTNHVGRAKLPAATS